ncbi:hypothetical protein [Fusibacter bizertensis]
MTVTLNSVGATTSVFVDALAPTVNTLSPAKELGVAETSLKDIKVEVKITKLDELVVSRYNEVAKENGATIASKANLTYVEAVQAIKNLLVASKLINE